MSIDTLDSVYTIWEEDPDRNVVFKRNTISFDPSINVGSTNGLGTASAAIAPSGYNVHVVWSFLPGPGGGVNGNPHIFYRRSTDGGASFGDSTINLSQTAGASSRPAIAVSGNKVYVVWEDNTPGNSDIFYTRSIDGGIGFSEPENLSKTPGPSSRPAIAVSGNNVYVVWVLDNTPESFFNILYRRSIDDGKNFGSTLPLRDTAGQSPFPAIAASGNNVYVVWDDNTPGNLHILLRKSTNNGTSFGGIKNLGNTGVFSGRPAIAASGNNVHVVWVGISDVLYRRSNNGGANFGDTVNLTNTIIHTMANPAVAASNNLT